MEHAGYRVGIVKRTRIASRTWEVRFEKPAGFSYDSGQYIHIAIPSMPSPDPRGDSRDFSLVSSPDEEALAVAVRDTGSGFKQALLSEDTLHVSVTGPYGVFTLPQDPGIPVVMIAGGIGITPFVSMIRFSSVHSPERRIRLLHIDHDRRTSAYTGEMRRLSGQYPTFGFIHRIGRIDADGIHRLASGNPDAEYYISGPPGMTANITAELTVTGVPSGRMHTEDFTGYADGDVLAGAASPADSASLPPSLDERMEGELSVRTVTDLEALLKALNTTAIVSETDGSGTITFVNDKFVEISKYTRSELIGQNHRILKSGYHSPQFYANLWATISRGNNWRGQIRNKAKDGSYYWVDTSIAPILDAGGKPVRYVSVRFPITELKKGEEEIRIRAARQNVLTALSQEALANTGLHMLFSNTVGLLSQTLGTRYSAIRVYLPQERLLRFDAAVGFARTPDEPVFRSPGVAPTLVESVLSGEGPVMVADLAAESRFTGTPVLRDAGVRCGIMVVIQGVDGPYGIVEAYSAKPRVFSSDDREFVQAVANLLANAVRNQLDKRKDEFLGMASHELKTPLTSIKTFVQILGRMERKRGDAQAIRFLERIDMQLDKVANLIADLLDISRINAGKLEFRDERFSLSDLIAETVEEQQMAAPSHVIRLSGSGNLDVEGDRYRIGQVLINLISNAVKYSPDGGFVDVESKRREGEVLVTVRDSGVGIPPDDIPRVFDRFYQSTGTDGNKVPGGLGLGLYISSEIIKRHGGRIWAENGKRGGTVMRFTLPATAAVRSDAYAQPIV